MRPLTSTSRRQTHRPPSLEAVVRHVADLREGTHAGRRSRQDRDELFRTAVDLLAPIVRHSLQEADSTLLLDAGEITETGVRASGDGGLEARWCLSWPAQRERGARSVAVVAHFERRFLHPHLRGSSVGEWPLNVYDRADAGGQLPLLRSIVAAEFHNLVFEHGHSILPARR